MRTTKSHTFSVCRFAVFALILLLLPLDVSDSVQAQSGCTAPSSDNQYWAPDTKVTVYIDPSFSQQETDSINAAVSNWSGQSALSGNNITVTTTSTDPGTDAQNTIRILNDPSESPNNLAFTTTKVLTGSSAGQMFNATIAFNRSFSINDVAVYDPNLSSAGTFVTKIFDHELGHAFGENDATVPTNPNTGAPDTCLESPGATVMNGFCGVNDTGNIMPTSVTSCDNGVVSNDIATKGGRKSTSGGTNPPTCQTGPQGNRGTGGVPCNTSPIIIDTEGEGFHLTSADGGVMFDIAGDGQPVQIAWTDAHYHNAFLALPGSDGLVHSGQELFGNFTPQPPSANPNGFIALAQYDKPENGGNGDGIIDDKDGVYSQLRLWIDENHDGVCQPNELHRLPELGIYSLALKYAESSRTDQFGNQFRYKAQVNPGDRKDDRDQTPSGDPGRWTYDVFLVTNN